MEKVKLGPVLKLKPLPCVLVSGGVEGGEAGFATAAWTGVVNSDPPMVYAALRPSRNTYGLVRRHGVFGINVPHEDMAGKVNAAGTLSGRSGDKFAALGLTRFHGSATGVALVAECPLNMECRIVREIALPSHTVFIGEVMECHADPGAALDGGMRFLGWDGEGYITAERLPLPPF